MRGIQNVIKDRKNIKLKYPTLILAAEFDIELANKLAKERHENLDNSEYFMIKDAGHCANMDDPLEFNRLVKEFISRNTNNSFK